MNTKPQFARLPWYPRDFASATRTWPLIARAVYRELLDVQWDDGGAEAGTLPDGEQELRELVRASAADWRVAWPYVAPKFPKVPGGRRNARLEEHRAAAVRDYQARVRGAQTTNRKLGRGSGGNGAGRHAERSLTETLTDSLSDTQSEELSER